MELIHTQTEIGEVHTPDPTTTLAIAQEVIVQDCYRFRELAKTWTPKTMLDLGVNVGVAAIHARSFWPDLTIVGFDVDADCIEAAKLNLPGVELVQANVGWEMRGSELLDLFGVPDLLKCDFEGGEVPFFHDMILQQGGILESLRVIVGEWHYWPARAFLERAFKDSFVTRFIDPYAGAGPWMYFYAVRKDLAEEIGFIP